MKNWVKYLLIIGVFVIEVAVTILGYNRNWDSQINAALVFASIMYAYLAFFSYLNKEIPGHGKLREESNKEHTEMRKESKKEHEEIKAAISMYTDTIPLSEVVDFEGKFVETQIPDKKTLYYSDVEIWIISNRVDEPAETINEIYKNLTKGVKYYYIIPNNNVNRSEEELLLTIEKIKNLNKNQKKLCIKYIKDELFDLMPTEIVDILYYCNPKSTDYSSNMKVFISFQSNDDNKDIYYKPVSLNPNQEKQFFIRMNDWKSNREWVELKAYD